MTGPMPSIGRVVLTTGLQPQTHQPEASHRAVTP
jgi:hypothetical protein